MTSYATLISDIQTWTQNQSVELSEERDTIIRLAMEDIVRDLSIQPFLRQTTGSFTVNSQTISRPNDQRLISVRQLRYKTAAGVWVRLDYRQQSFCDAFWPDETVTTASPSYYFTDVAGAWRVVGTPSVALTYYLEYTQRPELDSTTTTNWLTDNAYALLLAATLRKASMFIQDDRKEGLLAIHSADYTQELERVKQSELSFEMDARKV
jgi:hypothetical protein